MHTTSKIVCLATSLVWFAVQGALFAYDVDVDSIAYKVILWQNGNPANSSVVTGLYANLDTNGVGDHTECTVQAFREKRGRDTYWKINVTPKNNWGVFEVRYPMLFLPKFTPYHDTLIYGRQMGQKTGFTDMANYPEHYPSLYYRNDTTGYPELANKTAIFDARYPYAGGLNMQMMMYADDTGQGVMIWTPDSIPWVKDFIINKSELDAEHQSQGWRAYICHYPENSGQTGTVFQSPYQVVTTPFTNGWSEAAQVYKRWARSRWWCSLGKLYDRPGTPPWLKDTHLWGSGGWFSNTNGLGVAIALRDQIVPGKNYAVQNSTGTKYFNIPQTSAPDHLPINEADYASFMWSLEQSAQGIYMAPLCEFNWATVCYEDFEDYEPWSVMKPDGSWVWYGMVCDFNYFNNFPDAWLSPGFLEMCTNVLNYKEDLLAAWSGPTNQTLIDQMDEFPMLASRCASQKQLLTENWGGDTNIINNLEFESSMVQLCIGDNRMVSNAVATAYKYFHDMGVDALYIDTFPAHTVACYDNTHGHPVGFGKYITTNSHNFLAKIVSNSPQAVIVSESAGMENFMDTLQVEYMKDMGGSPNSITPLNKAIYHGFVEKTSYPLFYGMPGVYSNASDFCVALAYATHLGYMPGGPCGYGVLQHCGSDANKIQFLNQAIEIRKAYRDYLVAGEPLPDPAVTGAGSAQFTWFDAYGTYPQTISLPPVQVSKWAKSNDPTRVLLLFSNASGQSKTVFALGGGGWVTLDPYSWQAIEAISSYEEYYFDVGGPEDTGSTYFNCPGFSMAVTNGGFAYYFKEPSETNGYSVRQGTNGACFFVNLPNREESRFQYKRANVRARYKTSQSGKKLWQYCGWNNGGWVGLGDVIGDGQWHDQTFRLDRRFNDYVTGAYAPGITLLMSFQDTSLAVADLWLVNNCPRAEAELDVGGTSDPGESFSNQVPGFTVSQQGGYFTNYFLGSSVVDGYTVKESGNQGCWLVNIPEGEESLYTGNARVSILYKTTNANAQVRQYCGTNTGWVTLGNLVTNGAWQVDTFLLDSRFFDYLGSENGKNILMTLGTSSVSRVSVAHLWLEQSHLDVGGANDTGASYAEAPGLTMAVEGIHFNPPYVFEPPSVVDGYTVRENLNSGTWYVNIPRGEESLYTNAEVTVMYKTTSPGTYLSQYCGTNGWISLGNLTNDGAWRVQTFRLDRRLYDYLSSYDPVNIMMTFWSHPITIAHIWLKRISD